MKAKKENTKRISISEKDYFKFRRRDAQIMRIKNQIRMAWEGIQRVEMISSDTKTQQTGK